MKTLIIMTLPFLVGSVVAQQSKIVLPFPWIGWDSLGSTIRYPEIALRAGVEGAYRVTVEIDTSGKLIGSKVSSFNYQEEIDRVDSMFTMTIERGLRSTQWQPGTEDGISKQMAVSIPFVFYLSFKHSSKLIIINSYPAVVVRSH